ncbi:MAG TPA: hypothetical protein VD813_07400, partial [Pseudonocardia sp.]|nr:hypothetical protein [Pseudonocardia sp.]
MPLFLSARIAAALLCVLILVVPVACTSATDAPPPRPPEETSADLASRLELVFEVSRSGRYDPRALLVEVGGRPVLQEGDMSTPVEVDEVAASVVGMLVGIALAEGDLPGLSATLDELL